MRPKLVLLGPIVCASVLVKKYIIRDTPKLVKVIIDVSIFLVVKDLSAEARSHV